MGEGFEEVEGQRIEQTFPLPPLPRLSVIKEANLRQEIATMNHHQLSLTQERLLNLSEGLDHDMDNNESFEPTNVHPLFASNKCQWIGCETHCQTFHEFLHHLQKDHPLSEKSAAQTKVQMQIVDQLEKQVVKEKARLVAMVEHLKATEAEQRFWREKYEPMYLFMLNHSVKSSMLRRTSTEDDSFDTHPLSVDARPPHTYAALIRMAILESHNQQLTLNEIYNWFQTNYAYFKPSSATWKNAVRHNLSLHKCFRRVENIKGSVWVVDEEEFQRRRFQSRTNSRKPYVENRADTSAGSSRSSSPYYKVLLDPRNTPLLNKAALCSLNTSDEYEDLAPQDLSIKNFRH